MRFQQYFCGLYVLSIAMMLAGCQSFRASAICTEPDFAAIPAYLADCVARGADLTRVATQVEIALAERGLAGEVWRVDLLTSSPMAELVITYRGDLSPVDPQGMLVVLAYQDERWHVAFQTPPPRLDLSVLKNGHTVAGNWAFELDQVGDVQGDGAEDVLFFQKWSNITSTDFTYPKLLTVIDGEIRPILVDDHQDMLNITYQLNGPHVVATHNIGPHTPYQRTLALEAGRMVTWAEAVDPTMLPTRFIEADGTEYVALNAFCEYCLHNYGLYRIRNGESVHHKTPYTIRKLERFPDGNLYAFLHQAPYVLRVIETGLEAVYAPIAPTTSILATYQTAVTSQSEVWIAGGIKLIHLGFEQSTVYHLYANEVMIDPDDSVWVTGWDGREDSTCCRWHIKPGEITTYRTR